jgi:hypothetical protein
MSLLSDTWEWDGTSWTQVIPVRSPPPIPWPKLTFDQRLGGVLLSGGLGFVNDTWVWTGSTWLALPSVQSPPIGFPGNLVYDRARGRAVLVTGSSSQPQTWEWNGRDWGQRFPWPATPGSAGVLAHDAHRGRTVMFWSSSMTTAQTWEYVVPCDDAGSGAPGGGLSLQCTTPPQRGSTFCLSFPSALGGALFLLGRAPCLFPSLVLDPPTMCTRSFVHAPPTLVLPLAGNPAMPCFALANDPALFGQSFCLQGFALQSGGCLAPTDAVVATIQ